MSAKTSAGKMTYEIKQDNKFRFIEEGEGEPLVLLHGLFGALSNFEPLISYFKFNEARRSEEIIQRLGRGEKVALVTDAGTPGISDPGQRVVRAALEAGHKVESVPGACAFVAAAVPVPVICTWAPEERELGLVITTGATPSRMPFSTYSTPNPP